MMKTKFLLAPPLLFAFIFILEKIFLLTSVREYTQNWKKFEPYIYESRSELFDQLVKQYPERMSRGEKPGFIFGTSRSGEIAENNLGENNIFYLYNYSTPLASYPQHYYWIRKIIDAGIQPEFVILETDFIMFTEASMQYTLAYSLDIPFVLGHTDFFGTHISGDIGLAEGRGFEYRLCEKYLLKQLFALYRYPVDFKSITSNGKEQFPGKTGLFINRKARELIGKSVRENFGGMENTFLIASIPENKIKMDVEDKFHRFNLEKFSPSATQVIFFRKILEMLAEKNVPIILYRPVISKSFREKLARYEIEKISDRIIQQNITLAKNKYPSFRVKYFEPEFDGGLKCRKFMDATHLSSGCYGELISLLKQKIKE